jgi:hypothetical protein
MFRYVHLAFSVLGTLPLEYRTKPIFKAGLASEATTTGAPAEANAKAASEAATNNDLNIKFPISFAKQICVMRCTRCAAWAIYQRGDVGPASTIDPKRPIASGCFAERRRVASLAQPLLS